MLKTENFAMSYLMTLYSDVCSDCDSASNVICVMY